MAEFCRPELQRCEALLSLDLSNAAARVLADPIQIQQVLVNLVQNAAQAMLDCPAATDF